ncbi:MAG: LUD domain-containing protein [Planctomycetes bacterium]|nr:LUD domain-containing protein [Planctomycetota bacterium]
MSVNTSTSSSARDTILGRIREALRVSAPLPHMTSHATEEAATAGPGGLTILPADVARPWLPDGGNTPEERLALLTENLGKLRAEVHRVADHAAAAALVAGIARDRGWRKVAWHGHPRVEPLAAAVGCEAHQVDAAAFDKNALEACDAGITACDAAVAQTGSILVSSATCGGRALSILPHVHVVVVSLDQIVATLGDALDLVRSHYAGRLPSMLSFITGPSRTGDIERILVLGAHGPKELIVILVG